MVKDLISCCDGEGCLSKKKAEDESDAYAKGWVLLQITSRWRCAACARALEIVNQPEDKR